MSLSVVKFAILFSQILRHLRNLQNFSPTKITESTVFYIEYIINNNMLLIGKMLFIVV